MSIQIAFSLSSFLFFSPQPITIFKGGAASSEISTILFASRCEWWQLSSFPRPNTWSEVEQLWECCRSEHLLRAFFHFFSLSLLKKKRLMILVGPWRNSRLVRLCFDPKHAAHRLFHQPLSLTCHTACVRASTARSGSLVFPTEPPFSWIISIFSFISCFILGYRISRPNKAYTHSTCSEKGDILNFIKVPKAEKMTVINYKYLRSQQDAYPEAHPANTKFEQGLKHNVFMPVKNRFKFK